MKLVGAIWYCRKNQLIIITKEYNKSNRMENFKSEIFPNIARICLSCKQIKSKLNAFLYIIQYLKSKKKTVKKTIEGNGLNIGRTSKEETLIKCCGLFGVLFIHANSINVNCIRRTILRVFITID